jgi:hypothetical protein
LSSSRYSYARSSGPFSLRVNALQVSYRTMP